MLVEVIDQKPRVSANLGFFRFHRLNASEYTLTNDLGDNLILRNEDFQRLLDNRVGPQDAFYEKLVAMGILEKKEFLTTENVVRYRNRNMFLFRGTILHIFVVTLRCNLKCLYCQAGALKESDRSLDMTEETARLAVDAAFRSPSRFITIEFQGGEPLANWPIVESIINYANRKALTHDKQVEYSLVSNLILLTDEQLEFLVDNEVGITTSIDGFEALHDKHRGKGSYRKTVKNLKRCFEAYKEKYVLRLPGALMTMTRDSLPYPTEIVDEYVKLDQEAVQFRKVSPFGGAGRNLDRLDFSDAEYLAFYEKAFDYILDLNRQGTRFTERTAYLMLLKMLTDFPVNHMDFRSPCGAGIGQLAYNYNGDVYTCDEGRMMSAMGVEDFRLGSVHQNTYEELLDNDVVRAMCVASCLESLPLCDTCGYKPYCGVCPIYHFATEGSIFSKLPCNDRCSINKGIMDIIMHRAKDPETMDIFRSWIDGISLV